MAGGRWQMVGGLPTGACECEYVVGEEEDMCRVCSGYVVGMGVYGTEEAGRAQRETTAGARRRAR